MADFHVTVLVPGTRVAQWQRTARSSHSASDVDRRSAMDPAHTVVTPVIAAGVALTVIAAIARQPAPKE